MQPPNDLNYACELLFHSFMRCSCSHPFLLLVSIRLGRFLCNSQLSHQRGSILIISYFHINLISSLKPQEGRKYTIHFIKTKIEKIKTPNIWFFHVSPLPTAPHMNTFLLCATYHSPDWRIFLMQGLAWISSKRSKWYLLSFLKNRAN